QICGHAPGFAHGLGPGPLTGAALKRLGQVDLLRTLLLPAIDPIEWCFFLYRRMQAELRNGFRGERRACHLHIETTGQSALRHRTQGPPRSDTHPTRSTALARFLTRG